MALNRGDEAGKAAAIAYRDGAELQPVSRRTRPDGTGGFEIYPLTNHDKGGTSTGVQQGFSTKEYTEIRVALGGSGPADIHS